MSSARFGFDRKQETLTRLALPNGYVPTNKSSPLN
jgi:hypothetical protein